MPYFSQMAECFSCELIPLIITIRDVVLCYDVRGFGVEQMVVSTALDGAYSVNSGRVVELVQYVDCQSIEQVVVESLY